MNKENNNQEWKTENIKKEREARVKKVKQAGKIKKSGSKLFPIVASLLLVAILVWGAFATGLHYKFLYPMQVGEHKVSIPEYNFAYNQFYTQVDAQAKQGTYKLNNLGSIDLDALIPVKEGETPITVGEQLNTNVQKLIKQNYILKDLTKEYGIELTEEEISQVEKEIQDFVKQSGSEVLAKSRLSEMLGKGVNLKVLKEMTLVQALQNKFSREGAIKMPLDEAAINKQYEDHKEDYNLVTYREFNFNLSADESTPPKEDATEEEINKDLEEKEEKMGALEEQAKNMVSSVRSEQDFIRAAENNANPESKAIYKNHEATLMKGIRKNVLEQSGRPEVTEWLFDKDRKDGDIKLFPVINPATEKPISYSVIYFIKQEKPEEKLPNVVVALFSPDLPETEETSEDLEKQALADVKALADETLNKITSEQELKKEVDTLLADGKRISYNAFSNGFNFMPAEIRDWVLESGRVSGDKVVVEAPNQSGYALIYFKDLAEYPEWEAYVRETLGREKLQEVVIKALDDPKYDVKVNNFAMKFVSKLATNTRTGVQIQEEIDKIISENPILEETKNP